MLIGPFCSLRKKEGYIMSHGFFFFFLERTHKVWKQCNGTGLAVLLDSGTALKSRLKLPEQKVR